MTGAQRRAAPRALSATPVMTSRVVSALRGAAAGGLPSGTSSSIPKMTGITVTAISMSTTPATVGVRTRRNSESRAASANWKSEETTTSVASIGGPPWASAAMQTAMKAPEVPMRST